MALDIDTVYRDNVIKGDIHSGAHDPDKAEIRALHKSLTGAAANPSIVKQSKAALDAVTPASENYGGLVLNDPDATKNGYYYRSSSTWVKGRGFPDTFAQITLGGTANAQTGTASAGVSPADVLVYFATVSTDNTGPMTLSISGETARDVVNAAGNALSAGEWTGTVVFFLNSGGDYQLLFAAGAVAAAAQSATDAEAAQAAAEAARDDALAAVPNAFPVDRTALKVIDTTITTTAFLKEAGREGQFLWRTGDFSADVAADTAEGRVIEAAMVAATVGAWHRPRSRPYLASDFGVVADFDGSTGTDNYGGLQSCMNMLMRAGGGELILPKGVVACGQKLVYANAPLRMVGEGVDASQLIFTGASTGGIEFSDNTGDANPISIFHAEGFSVKTTEAGVGTGIKAIWAPKTNNPTVPHFLTDHVLVCGWDDIVANYFARGVHTVDASAFRVRDLSVLASGSSMTECLWIEHAADASRYGGQLTGFNFQGGAKGLRITGHAENITAAQYEVVGQEICFDIDGTASTIPGGRNPVFRLENGHCNSKYRTIKIDDWEVVGIVNNDVYSGVGTDDVDGQNILVVNCRHLNIAANKIATGQPGLNREGLYTIDCSDITVTGNSIESFKNASILADGATSGDRLIVVGNSIKGQSSAQRSAQGVSVLQGRIKSTIVGNTVESCTKGIEGVGDDSIITGNSLKDCPTGVEWAGTNYTAKSNQFASDVTTQYVIGGSGAKKEIDRTATVNPASVAAGGRTNVLVAVAGAVLGDFVQASPPYDISDLMVTANVQNTGIVGLYFYNPTGGAVDLASGTWKFRLTS